MFTIKFNYNKDERALVAGTISRQDWMHCHWKPWDNSRMNDVFKHDPKLTQAVREELVRWKLAQTHTCTRASTLPKMDSDFTIILCHRRTCASLLPPQVGHHSRSPGTNE
jgi:hypothetical protein